MNFIMYRDRIVASTMGHVLSFKKGKPTHVPPEMVREVLALGAVAEDEAFDPDAKDDKTPGPEEPTDPVARQVALFDAFATMVKRGRREDFTAGGQPHQKVLATELGWPVSAKERDAAWVEFNGGNKS